MDPFIDLADITVETERLLLREFHMSDLDDFYEYASVPGVGEMAGWPHHTSKEASAGILRLLIESDVFAIFHKQAGKVIGSLGLHPSWVSEDIRYKHLKAKEVGYVLSKAYWGQGLVPEAVEAVARLSFSVLGLDALTCSHFSSNRQSRRVIEKCGFSFVKEGTYFSMQLQKEFSDMMYIRLSPGIAPA